MDALLDQARTIYEGEIDFQGQSLAEFLSTLLLSISGAIAFLVGFSTQNIYNTLYIGLGGTALTFLVVVPPWPIYNQVPPPWLPPKNQRASAGGARQEVDMSGISVEVDGKKVR